MKKCICSILMILILLFECPMQSVQADLIIDEFGAVVVEDPTPTIKTRKDISVLFIGNSKTFYNNMPRMFTNIAAKDKDCVISRRENIHLSVLTWSSHELNSWGTGYRYKDRKYADKIREQEKQGKKKNKEDEANDSSKKNGKNQNNKQNKNAKDNNNANQRVEQKGAGATENTNAGATKVMNAVDPTMIQVEANLHDVRNYKESMDPRERAVYNALYDEEGNPIMFDVVVLQGQTNEIYSANAYSRGALAVCEELKKHKNLGKNTQIVFNSVWGIFGDGQGNMTKETVWNQQNLIDNNSLAARATLLQNGYDEKNVSISYAGRAVLNYLSSYDAKSDLATTEFSERPLFYSALQENSPISLLSFYPITEKPFTPCNDLITNDKRHPTQLGSLLEAATLYATIYSDDPSVNNLYGGFVPEGVLNMQIMGWGPFVKSIAINDTILLRDLYEVSYHTYLRNHEVSVLDYYTPDTSQLDYKAKYYLTSRWKEKQKQKKKKQKKKKKKQSS